VTGDLRLVRRRLCGAVGVCLGIRGEGRAVQLQGRLARRSLGRAEARPYTGLHWCLEDLRNKDFAPGWDRCRFGLRVFT
jgi:hypothetical protein